MGSALRRAGYKKWQAVCQAKIVRKHPVWNCFACFSNPGIKKDPFPTWKRTLRHPVDGETKGLLSTLGGNAVSSTTHRPQALGGNPLGATTRS
jgi:hypothetical protein